LDPSEKKQLEGGENVIMWIFVISALNHILIMVIKFRRMR
jgi:hypothetical protein